MGWILTILSIIGLILCVYKKKIGFALGSVANLILSITNFNYEIYSQAFLFLAYFIITSWGWVKWGKKESEQKNIEVIRFFWRNENGKSMPIM